MPTISKIRIVNFSYNNGRRRIADQIFPLYFDGKPQDTLLNLENGGGKSVLVQLMMQPILPRATMNGRKIEDYFSKTGDPAYILLEWKLDKSEDFFMTGIALCPGENVEEGGGSMRYFTFTAQYGRYGNEEYDIAHLSLSEQNGRQFRFITYRGSMELIKNLQKHSPAKVHYYHSDDVNDYYRELNEFGISLEEWRQVMVPINNHEGGVKDLFENYKTTDKLLNEMLIATIDRAIAGMSEGGDASLPQMILHYAQKMVDNEKSLTLKKQMQEFSEKLSGCREPANNLWKLSDRWNHAIGEIYGFSHSLLTETQKQQGSQKQLQSEYQQAQYAMSRLELEQASDEWYLAQEKLSSARDWSSLCSENEESAQHALEQNRRKQNVLEAAGIYRTICRLNSRAAGLRANIEANEKNTNVQQRLNSLRYSIFIKASKEHDELSAQTETLDKECSKLEEQITATRNQKIAAQKEIESCRSGIAVLNDRLSGFQTGTDALLSLLSLDLSPNILGEYQAEEVQKTQSQLQKEAVSAKGAVLTCEENLKQLQAEQTKRGEEKTAIAVHESELSYQLEALENQLFQYHDAEQKADAILQRYDLTANAKFHPEQRRILQEKRMQFRSAQRDAQRQRETAEKQLAALREGSLHIPGNLLKELNELGIQFTTGEIWLRQKEEQRDRMLKLFPELPYCIILTKNDFQKIQSKLENLWLPCLGCFVTYDTLDRLLKEDKPFFTGELLTLSRYAKESLCMRDEYEKKLNESCVSYAAQEESYEGKAEQTEQDIRFLDMFPYSENTFAKLNQKKAQTESDLQDAEQQKKNIEEKSGKILIAIDDNRHEQAKLNHSLHIVQQNMEKFAEWCSKMEAASEWRKDRTALSHKEDKLSQRLEQLSHADEEQHTSLQNSKEQIKELKTRLEELLRWKKDCTGAPESPILTEGTRDLWESYQALQKSLNSTIQDLRKSLNTCEQDLKEQDDSLNLKKLQPEEYQNIIYSHEKLERLKAEQDNLEKASHEKERDRVGAEHKLGAASANFDTADKYLKKLAAEPIGKDEIKGNFAARKTKILNLEDKIKLQLNNVQTCLNLLDRVQQAAEELTAKYVYDGADCPVVLEKDLSGQLKNLRANLQECRNELDTALQKYRIQLNALDGNFSSQNEIFQMIARPLIQKMDDLERKEYDRYYEIYEMIGNDLDIIQKQIALYEQELSEVNSNRKNLVTHCFAHGKRIYEQLNRISESSSIRLPELSRKLRMLRIELPEQVDEGIARERMASYVEGQASELASAVKASAQPSSLAKKAAAAVSSRVLLNIYIGTNDIPVKVYKIDMDIQNSDYRLWENAISANSGGEKFVVYFAVILSLMYYTRTRGGILNGEQTSTLIMDNPFGPISSEHLLRPMFAIAKRFGVQLICLTDLDTADIVSCFALRYMIRIRPIAYSGYSVVEFESNRPSEVMEQAFYKGEQMSLFH